MIHTRLAVALVLSLAVAGCSELTNFDPSQLEEDSYERCRDRVDNDGNGLSDCDDLNCVQFSTFCNELTPGSCSDAKDNDGDGFTDCNDPGCKALQNVCTEKTSQACDDGVDNDNDGFTDCDDPDCKSGSVNICNELTAVDCSDGKDNDNDGLIDCNDFSCRSHKSCCTQSWPKFTGDDFTYKTSCTVHVCAKTDTFCCVSNYDLCNMFDPTRWVVWGLPRARQDSGAFVSNEPCDCNQPEPSGVVSVEPVHLEDGLEISFDLGSSGGPGQDSICAGVTRTTIFPDDLVQCAGTAPPVLMLGICLEAAKAGGHQISFIVDGVIQRSTAAPGGGAPVHGVISINSTEVKLAAGSLVHTTPPMSTDADQALVLISGKGTSATLRKLVVKDPDAKTKRCRAPDRWYRHLGRGEPVVTIRPGLTRASQPTVMMDPVSKDLFMLFHGKSSDSWTGFFAATSGDGTTWIVSDKPVIPASKLDITFGQSPASPSLLHWKGEFHVWYTRLDEVAGQTQQKIAHATSLDGKTWTTSAALTLPAGSAFAWDSKSVSSPTVILGPDGKTLWMWYVGVGPEVGAQAAIGGARSTDGVTWTRFVSNPVLAPAVGGTELEYDEPAVAYDTARKLYMMWFTHWSFKEPPSLCHAVSTDGKTWVRAPDGPVFESNTQVSFDAAGVKEPSVIISDRIRLWFGGVDLKGRLQIGYAENRGAW